MQATDDDEKVVITADNPISCLFEYSKKVKIPDPDFECVAENLLETWQKGNQTFKKVRLSTSAVIGLLHIYSYELSFQGCLENVCGSGGFGGVDSEFSVCLGAEPKTKTLSPV